MEKHTNYLPVQFVEWMVKVAKVELTIKEHEDGCYWTAFGLADTLAPVLTTKELYEYFIATTIVNDYTIKTP